jgi:hypothetical protein
MIKTVSIAIIVAVVAIGGLMLAGTLGQQNSPEVAATAPTPEQIASDYADTKATLDRNIHAAVETLNKPANKTLAAEIDTSVDKLRQLAGDYTAKKQAGASAADLQAIATDYAQTVQSTLKAARALRDTAGQYRENIQVNKMLLGAIDPDKAAADEQGIIAALQPVQEGLMPVSVAVKQIGPAVTKVRAALSEKEKSGAEISDADVAAEYLKAATAVLEAGATPVAN